jgi:hypothetical protein
MVITPSQERKTGPNHVPACALCCGLQKKWQTADGVFFDLQTSQPRVNCGVETKSKSLFCCSK